MNLLMICRLLLHTGDNISPWLCSTDSACSDNQLIYRCSIKITPECLPISRVSLIYITAYMKILHPIIPVNVKYSTMNLSLFPPFVWVMNGVRLFFLFFYFQSHLKWPLSLRRFRKAAPGRQIIQIHRASSVHNENINTQPLSRQAAGHDAAHKKPLKQYT